MVLDRRLTVRASEPKFRFVPAYEELRTHPSTKLSAHRNNDLPTAAKPGDVCWGVLAFSTRLHERFRPRHGAQPPDTERLINVSS